MKSGGAGSVFPPASPVWGDATRARRAEDLGMAHTDGWPALFSSAFGQSRNAMVLVDGRRRIVEANAACVKLIGGRSREALAGRPVWELLADGPLASEREWRDFLATRRFAGEAGLKHADGSVVAVQWGATTEVVTGHRLVLFVVLSTSRWGAGFRRAAGGEEPPRRLSAREREVVGLVALGATSPEIADELHITPETVRTHVRNAMRKQGARSRAHLVAKVLGEAL
jgi:PAS domain S-box-containing protein